MTIKALGFHPSLRAGFGGGFGVGFNTNGQFFINFIAQAELGELVNLSTGPQVSFGRDSGNMPVRQISTDKFIGAQYAIGAGPVASGGYTRSTSGNSFAKGVGKLGGGLAGQVAMVVGTNSKIALNSPICK